MDWNHHYLSNTSILSHQTEYNNIQKYYLYSIHTYYFNICQIFYTHYIFIHIEKDNELLMHYTIPF